MKLRRVSSIPKSLCAEPPTDLVASRNGPLTPYDSTWGCQHLNLPGLHRHLSPSGCHLPLQWALGPGSHCPAGAEATRETWCALGANCIPPPASPGARIHTLSFSLSLETELGRRQTESRRRAARGGTTRTRTAGRVPPRWRSSVAEARPGSHRRSFTKKVSRPAPLTHSPAPAPAATPAPAVYGSVPGSAPVLAREPAAATAPSRRGPGRVRLELTVPPARRARRPRAPCSRRTARRRGNPHHPPTTAHARTRRTSSPRASVGPPNRASAHSPRPFPARPALRPPEPAAVPGVEPTPSAPVRPGWSARRSALSAAACRTADDPRPGPRAPSLHRPFCFTHNAGHGLGSEPGGN